MLREGYVVHSTACVEVKSESGKWLLGERAQSRRFRSWWIRNFVGELCLSWSGEFDIEEGGYLIEYFSNCF